MVHTYSLKMKTEVWWIQKPYVYMYPNCVVLKSIYIYIVYRGKHNWCFSEDITTAAGNVPQSSTSSQFSLLNVHSLKNEYTEHHHQHSNAKKVCHPILMLHYTWWRHQMEFFFSLLALWAGNSPVTGELPSKRPVTRSLDLLYDLRLNKRLNKQSRRGWFETPSRPLWRHSKETFICDSCHINKYSLSQ